MSRCMHAACAEEVDGRHPHATMGLQQTYSVTARTKAPAAPIATNVPKLSPEYMKKPKPAFVPSKVK